MTARSRLLAAAIAAAAALAAGCGSSSTSPTTTNADVKIQMVGDKGNQSYSPSPATVKVGQTVAWHNADSTAHTSTQDTGRFDTGSVAAGSDSPAITMSTAGTFTYHCTIHPGMVGTITVQ
ncbi:MAG TPA: cupredoxin domain-containing protein [Vicinamibacterales bacterium]|jgi:plastocyanin